MAKSGGVRIDLYEMEVVVVVYENMDDAKQFMSKKLKNKADGIEEFFQQKLQGFSINEAGKYYIGFSDASLTHNTIAHECFHATNRAMDNRGIEDEEAAAWFIGYLTSEVYKILKKLNADIKS